MQKEKGNKDVDTALTDDLLANQHERQSHTDSNTHLHQEQNKNALFADKMEFWPALGKILKSSLMPILNYFIGFLNGSICLILLGYTDNPEVLQAAYGLGRSTQMILMMSFSIGLSNTLMIYVPQAFGSGLLPYCGIYTNRQILLNFLVLAVFGFPLIWSYKLFILMGQDEEIASYAAVYTRLNILGSFCFTVYQCYQRFCYGQRNFKIPMIAIIFGFLIFVVFVNIFFFWFKWDMLAVALSVLIMQVTQVLVQYILINRSGQYEQSLYPFFDKETIKNLSHQFWIGLQSLSLNVWSLWAIEAFLIIASQMGELEMATQTIVRNISNLFYMIPLGFSLSSNVLVGNNIGSADIPRAKYYTYMCIFAGFIWSFLSIAVLFLLKPLMLKMFTSSEEVRTLLSDIYYLMIIFVFFDCISVVCAGIIRSMGKQGLASIITCVGYWVIGIPSAIFMVFKLDWGMTGLLLGISSALVFNFFSYAIFIACVDWEQVVEEMRARKNLEKKIQE